MTKTILSVDMVSNQTVEEIEEILTSEVIWEAEEPFEAEDKVPVEMEISLIQYHTTRDVLCVESLVAGPHIIHLMKWKQDSPAFNSKLNFKESQ